MLLDNRFLRLLPYSRHDVREYPKLIKVAHFDAEFVELAHLRLSQLKDECDALQTITHELRQIIEKVLVHELQVLPEVLRDLVEVEENLLEVLLDQRQ